MRPSQVLDRQVDLVSRLNEPYVQDMVRMMMHRQAETVEMLADENAQAMADFFLTGLLNAARGSYAYRVTPDMVDLIEFASEGLDDDDSWDRTLAPTGCGFVWFDRPLTVGAWEDGSPLQADALLWGPGPYVADGKARTSLTFLMDPTRPGAGPADSVFVDEVARVMGHWDLIGWTSVPDGSTMGEPKVIFDPRELPGYEDRWKFAPEQANDKRLVHALWLLLGQTITALREEKIDRASRRRAVRKAIPPRVTTIALRRTEHRPSEGETHVEWQHRWIVRGHWRWQACGAGRQDRRRIWVNPHVKGPEGMPLKQSEKVYDLRR